MMRTRLLGTMVVLALLSGCGQDKVMNFRCTGKVHLYTERGTTNLNNESLRFTLSKDQIQLDHNDHLINHDSRLCAGGFASEEVEFNSNDCHPDASGTHAGSTAIKGHYNFIAHRLEYNEQDLTNSTQDGSYRVIDDGLFDCTEHKSPE